MIADAIESTVRGYIDGVLEGRLVVSKLVRSAVERHVKDLAKQSTSDFPYHFDAKAATKACRFYPTFLRHSIGHHAGMPFDLEPWQMFGEWCLFGWKRDANNTRRFRTSYESVGRKNGKTTRGGGRSIYMAMADWNPCTQSVEQVAQVILCATKKEQVEKVSFAEILRMRQASTQIRNRCTHRVAKTDIQFHANEGSINCVGSDKPFDGLNPHYVLIDELHAWREYHREFYDTMVTGSGSRDQSLIAMTTTAGDDKSHLWKERYDYAAGVATGLIDDPSFFSFVCQVDDEDDPLDESVWIKANPNLGVSISMDYLRQQAIEAKSSAAGMNRFLRYHCNRAVSSSESAFDLNLWDACNEPYSDWSNSDAIAAGVDLGARDDFAAYALCARFPISGDSFRYEIKVKAYIAEDCKRDLTRQPFASWLYRDLLKKCRYPIAELRADLVRDCQEYNIRTVAYDPYNGQQLGEDLESEGITAARMAQNQSNFNEPIQEFIKAVQDCRFIHGNNPLLRWCASNAVISRDRNDRWMFDKRQASEKIDPIVASVMAFRVAMLEKSRPVGSLFVI